MRLGGRRAIAGGELRLREVGGRGGSGMDRRAGSGLSCSRHMSAVPWLLCSLSLSKLTARLSCPCCQVSSREHRRAAASSPSECGDVAGLGDTAGAAEMARGVGFGFLACFQLLSVAFWAWPGSTACAREADLGGAHRNVF